VSAVSAENVELVLSFQLDRDGDVAGLLADEDAIGRLRDEIQHSFHRSVQCTMRFPGMAPVLYRDGLDGLQAAWRDWLKRWESYRIEVENVIDAGERIVVVHRAHGRARPGAPEETLRRAGVWTVRDHKIVHVDFNVPVTEALAAVGPAK
jgi:hypothetical protein